MSAIAQALAKVGLIEKTQADNMTKEKECFHDQYKKLSSSIRNIFKEKRRLEKLQNIIKEKNFHTDTFFNEIKELYGIPKINLSAEPNKELLLTKLQASLNDLEQKAAPMLQASRKLENDWGFSREASRHQK